MSLEVECSFTCEFQNFVEKMGSERSFRLMYDKVLESSKWYLKIRQHESHGMNKQYVAIYLLRDDAIEFNFEIDFTITLLATDASLNVSKRCTTRTLTSSTSFGFEKFMSVDKILANRNIYLPEDTLRIQCCMVKKMDTDDKTIDCESVLQEDLSPNALSSDLLRFYLDEKFCDIKITAGDKTFNVHKALLCARSPVFSAMFSSDTKEMKNSAVDITDLDSDTVGLMLAFIYSDAFDEMQVDQVALLYAAADKYEILCLKERCSTVLKTLLNKVNACDVYALADLHQDNNLKAAVQNYIFIYAHTILKSSKWAEFMLSNPRLSSEIMHKICLKHLEE